MKLSPAVAAAVLMLLPLTACTGGDEPTEDPTTPTPSSSSTPTASSPTASSDLIVAPGRFGPAEVGMTQDEAVATGLFDADVKFQGEACEGVHPLQWKKAFTGVDVLTDESGTIVSMGTAESDGPRTEVGFGVGTTFDELIEGLGEQLSDPEPAGYGQVGVFVHNDDDWLGFLFGDAESVEQLGNDHGMQVTFVEVTEGEKPALMRDGC